MMQEFLWGGLRVQAVAEPLMAGQRLRLEKSGISVIPICRFIQNRLFSIIRRQRIHAEYGYISGIH